MSVDAKARPLSTGIPIAAKYPGVVLRSHATFAAWGFERTAEKSHPGFTRVTFIEMRKALAG